MDRREHTTTYRITTTATFINELDQYFIDILGNPLKLQNIPKEGLKLNSTQMETFSKFKNAIESSFNNPFDGKFEFAQLCNLPKKNLKNWLAQANKQHQVSTITRDDITTYVEKIRPALIELNNRAHKHTETPILIAELKTTNRIINPFKRISPAIVVQQSPEEKQNIAENNYNKAHQATILALSALATTDPSKHPKHAARLKLQIINGLLAMNANTDHYDMSSKSTLIYHINALKFNSNTFSPGLQHYINNAIDSTNYNGFIQQLKGARNTLTASQDIQAFQKKSSFIQNMITRYNKLVAQDSVKDVKPTKPSKLTTARMLFSTKQPKPGIEPVDHVTNTAKKKAKKNR